ncbi:MAG TPA: hypothetical protein VN645_00375 [Steroidobacteraceae bacterium]|nr:hypothetical protein [Steroidobacteraceae bacterium]
MDKTAHGKSGIGDHMVAGGYDPKHYLCKPQLDCAIRDNERQVVDIRYASAECKIDFRGALKR